MVDGPKELRRLPAIDPRALLTFRAVCDTGSISAAARALNLSQPSVSNTIALLERRLGAILFERRRGGIALTREGELLQRRAEALATLLSDATSEVELARHHIAGPLRIGGTPGALLTLLPGAIMRVEEAVGDFALSAVERPDEQLLDMLRKGEIELAFVTTQIESVPVDMVEVTCARDPFALIAGQHHADLPDHVSLRDVESYPWVLPEARGAFRRQVDALFIAAGVSIPRTAIRCDSLLTTRAIVRDTDRVTLLPRTVALDGVSDNSIRAISIEEAVFERSVGVLRLADRPLTPLSSAMLAALACNP
ncbi:LysR family transcriptional regulator [Novosphingobium sp. P6W]|uniref:LysR family transcriptional regulator n=1 Tax=Novosphingobium sp. P6W TaxID=1609758 RepID=UPI0005C4763B|nr:LysR family transcriptional regulator [Novosphingobium sp. P6W]AXB78755.1 LysR family transcriptional regulator [Novosphingobium sp. P6W]